ncbi:hypothetical protein Tco_0837862 [Tanacetum coccineum]
MFDARVFDEEEVEVEKVVSTAEVTTASATTTIDELTLAQTLIEIKAAKPKAVTTATTTAVTRPKARGVVVKEPSEFTKTTSQPSQDKGDYKQKNRMLFDNTMKWVDSFVPMDTEVMEGTEVDDEAEMKKLMEIVPDDEVAIDAIPLATKSPIIVDWKIIKERKIGYFQIIRADRSSKRYSSMIRMLQNIDREDLETL